MQPVYGLTAGLTNKMVTKLVAQILEEEPERKEYLPEEIRMEYKLAEFNFAVRQIHFPRNMESFLVARDRLAFDEFFLFILALRRMKEKAGRDGKSLSDGGGLEDRRSGSFTALSDDPGAESLE